MMLFIYMKNLADTKKVELPVELQVALPDRPDYNTFCESVDNSLRVSNGNLQATELTGADKDVLYLDFVEIYNNAIKKMARLQIMNKETQ